MDIANARIGVKNRELPFISDMQRNLFLSQLDKKEQELLGSVDGQKDDSYDKLVKDDQQVDSTPSVKAPAFRVVEKVDRDSGFDRIAKDILKFYLDGYIINPINDIVSSAEIISNIIDRGTVSIGVSGNASLFAAGGLNGNIGLVMDTDGDVGLVKTYGGFGGIPTLSIVGFASISNAPVVQSERATVLVGKFVLLRTNLIS
ncbi:MAG: hypothetical protein GX417_04205 [Clostridiales bacterium]|nr:hypothetical protein [Clostridiales bacterium]